MRPDRVVVGEVRGGEALDMLQALNTGHDGSMSTIHANGPSDALARLETLVLLADAGLPLAAIRAQLAASIDVVVFVARRRDGVRRVEADLAATPEQVVESWAIAVVAAALLTAAFAPSLALPAALAAVVAGPVALRLARTRRERRFAVALPGALEQVAAELRGGGTVAVAVERLASRDGAIGPDLRRVHLRTQ